MKKLFCFITCTLLLTACMKHDFSENENYRNEQIKENLQKVFGVTFDPNHDWCTTTSGSITINNIPNTVEKVQLLAYLESGDVNEFDEKVTSVTVLNEGETNGQNSITLTYDVPKDNLGLFSCFISKDGSYTYKKVGDDNTSNSRRALTRGTEAAYTLPVGDFYITNSEKSYANEKYKWNNGEMLYQIADYESQKMSVVDYDEDYKTTFRMLIFSYFKNGRKYNNLPLVKESGYYNEKAYPITTGDEPIIVSPVYKNDGGYKEVENSDLYYYYFKESELGDDPVAYIESLPKYKAIQFNQCIKGDDVISKHASYALMYFGEGVPEIGVTKGSYQFPKGYKIGFMVRAKTTAEGGKKQGELYGDGRLNNNINNYDKCNFKSSKLGTDGPRMAWLNVNGKLLLCCESGTDADFNDIILEVEGGIEGIDVPYPDMDYNYYTFCFEDTYLGDYDMNDVVIKGRRINETTVEYSVMACGAYDNLKIMNISGKVINSNTEVHAMFGVDGGFINTVKGSYIEPVVEKVTVNKTFSFLDETTQPYIYDMNTGQTVKLSKKGENPYGIMIPYDFKYPLEKTCIKDAYLQFNNWGENPIISTGWYKEYLEDKVY